MNNPLPFLVRSIDPNLTITDEILDRELNCGADMMKVECEKLNKFIDTEFYRFTWNSYRKDSHTIEFFLMIDTPNECGSWL